MLLAQPCSEAYAVQKKAGEIHSGPSWITICYVRAAHRLVLPGDADVTYCGRDLVIAAENWHR